MGLLRQPRFVTDKWLNCVEEVDRFVDLFHQRIEHMRY